MVAALKKSPLEYYRLEYYRLWERFNSVNVTLGNVFVQVYKDRSDGEYQQVLQIGEPSLIEGMPIGALTDVFASKLNAVRFRSTERDLIDVVAVDTHGGLSLEDGMALHSTRYRMRAGDQILAGFANMVAGAAAGSLEKGEVAFPEADIMAAADMLRKRLPDVTRMVGRSLVGGFKPSGKSGNVGFKPKGGNVTASRKAPHNLLD